MLKPSLKFVALMSVVLAADWCAELSAEDAIGDSTGEFEIAVTTGDESETFAEPVKAMAELRSAARELRRADDGESEFRAVIKLNGGVYEFDSPTDSLTAVQAVAAAMARTRKLKIDFGKVGNVDDLLAEDDKAAQPGGKPDAAAQQQALTEQQKLLYGQQIVQYRIQQAFASEMLRSRGRSTPNPQRLQQVIQGEIQKGQAEGLLPQTASAAGFQTNPLELAQKAELEGIRRQLAVAFRSSRSPADKDGAAEEKK